MKFTLGFSFLILWFEVCIYFVTEFIVWWAHFFHRVYSLFASVYKVVVCMYILHKKCIYMYFCILVDGSWGEWFAVSNCSVTCGIGQFIEIRLCEEPSPTFGGLYCLELDNVRRSNGEGRITNCTLDACPGLLKSVCSRLINLSLSYELCLFWCLKQLPRLKITNKISL